MNNMECLVTKLKADIMDDDIYRLGEIRLQKDNLESISVPSQQITINGTSPIYCVAYGNGEFYADNQLTTLAGKDKVITEGRDVSFYVTNGAMIGLRKKYDLVSINTNRIAQLDLKDLAFCHQLSYLYIGGIGQLGKDSGDLKDFVDTLPKVMSRFALVNFANITGDISSLNHIAIKQLELNSSSLIKGDIGSLNVQNLESLSIAQTSIGGSIEDLITKLVNAGRSSGTIAVPNIRYRNNVTYQGVLLSNNVNVPPAATTNKITWDADRNVTWS